MRLEGQRLSAALEDFLPDFEFAFEGSGGEVGGIYYHTDRTRQLNAHFGDMLHKIQDLEVRESQALPLEETATGVVGCLPCWARGFGKVRNCIVRNCILCSVALLHVFGIVPKCISSWREHRDYTAIVMCLG